MIRSKEENIMMEVTIGAPENIFEVYVNDFGDHYHRSSDAPLTKLEQEAMQIRRRYKNVLEFINAVNIYREYIEQLLNKYGNIKLLKLLIKNKTIEEFIPPIPRMKNTKFNKYILKHRILISTVDTSDISDDVLEMMDSQEITDPRVEFKASKIKDEKILEFIQEDINSFSSKKFKNITSIDYLEEYFRNKNKSKNKNEERKLPSVTELLSGKYKNKYEDTSEDDEIIFYRGQYLKRSTADELMMYNNLSQLGWDGIKIMKRSGASKKATKLLKEQLKKDKKKKKKNKKEKAVDDFLVKIMGDNDYDDFEEFEKDMLNMKSSNIFK